MKEEMSPVQRISFTISIIVLILLTFFLIFLAAGDCCGEARADAFEGEPGGKPFRQFVTPDSGMVKDLAAGMDSIEDILEYAGGWNYKPDMPKGTDNWTLPAAFILNDMSGDCEEFANTFVSLARSMGMEPENIRVAIGEIKSGRDTPGHAWVEEYQSDEWIVHELYNPDIELKIIRTWAYYNDIYHLYESGAGNAPEHW